jgi:hypothetical protein
MNDIYEVAREAERQTNLLIYPTRPAKPKRSDFTTNQEWGKALDYWEKTEYPRFVSAKQEYDKQEKEVTAKFEESLADFCGVLNHPKRAQIFEFAWSEGHSSGYSEVATWYDRIVELIK